MKQRRSIYTLAAIVFMALIIAVGCKHHPEILPGTGGNGGGTDTLPWVNPDPCDPDTVYFANTIQPLLNAYCGSSNCHDAVDPEEGINVTTYGTIMSEGGFVEPGDANSSDMIEVLYKTDTDQMPPADQPQLTADQIALLQLWINQGAHNNSCTADCDTSLAVTFSGIIMPIIQNNCVGCHGNSNPSGGVSLTNYALVSAQAESGNLMHSLNGTGGNSIMPANSYGLPQCMIDQVQEWIDAGMPNN
jgi:uncharacterized membrane protein